MPSRLIADFSQIQPGNPSNDRLILAPSAGWGDQTIKTVAPAEYGRNGSRSGGYFLKKQPLFISANLRQSRELIDLMYKTGHSAPVRSRIGGETLQDGITFAMSGNSLLQILQMISQDKNPSYVHLGRTLGTRYNIYGTSSSGEDLSANAALNIKGGAAAKLAAQAAQLRIAVTSGAKTAAEAKITIVGTVNGSMVTEEVKYVNDVDFKKVIATQNAFSALTSFTPSGFTAGTVHVSANPYTTRETTAFPAAVTVVNAGDVATDGEIAYQDDLRRTENVVRLNVAPNNAARVKSGSTSARITFKGMSRGGQEIIESVLFTGTGQLAAKQTVASYAEITEITATGFGTGSTVTITCQDKATEVTFTPQDAETSVLVDAELVKGGATSTYRSLLANEITIAINRNDPLAAVMGILGYSVDLHKNIAGGEGKSDLNGIVYDDPDIFIGYETELTVAGVRAPLINGSLSINNNYAYSDVIGGKPEQEILPYRDGKRATMFEGEIVFSPRNKIALDFDDNATYEDVVIKAENTDDGTFPFQFRVEFDECQLATSGDTESPETGMTTQPFNLRAYSTDSNQPTDYRFVVVCNDPIFLRRYDIAA